MCGIFGYIGPRDTVTTTLNGLKRLAYRGYDSAGIAGVTQGQIKYCKEVGKIEVLEKAIESAHFSLDVAIAQTRWATHGKPSKINAHPHLDNASTLAVVHNGIIENYESLRKNLLKRGVTFISETDTEVISHLISSLYEGDILVALQKAIPMLKGAFAIALVHRDYPDCIIAVAHECPLVVGIGQDEAFLASDSNAFAPFTREAVFLANSEIAIIKKDKLEIYNSSKQRVDKQRQMLEYSEENISKGNFEHYTLKEIFEQPQALRSALLSRFTEEYGTAIFEEFNFDPKDLSSIERILILACGTSWHAGCLGAYMIEDMARIPVQVEISSEFRYKNPVIPPGTLVIAISQSGETADTLAAIRELKAKGSKIFAICNVHSSTIAREADVCLFLRAGPEIGVCSTKAFTSQVTVLALFCLMIARIKHLSKTDGKIFLEALKLLPEKVQQILDRAPLIQALAKKYSKYQDFFFIGRRYMYPASLEAALKLKEISYINANGYPAGELKHGPIALINSDTVSVALCANKFTYDKLLSNLTEIKARDGLVLAIAQDDDQGLESIADDIIRVPSTIDPLAAIPTSVAAQLLAYYIAKERGTEIDQPRNLAKSVTVE